ncbi:MAG: DinB family protein [Gemmatimonadales bacterium]
MIRSLPPLIAHIIAPARGQAWHGGPTPIGTLRGVSAALAHRRPAPGRHSIWELALHIAYWNYAVRRRLLRRDDLPRFPRSPANWPSPPPAADESRWAEDRALVAREHRLLAETIRSFPPSLLARPAATKKRWTYGEMLVGILVHDAYHVGQIQMLKRLLDPTRRG